MRADRIGGRPFDLAEGALFGFLLVSMSQASVVQQLSFEEVVQGADAVVLGTVAEVPVRARYDPRTRCVFKENRVIVEQYLKGTGPEEIIVATLGGEFEAHTESGLELQVVEYGGQPQLPAEGTAALLFLKNYGAANRYLIYSASHGIVRVEGSGPDRVVALVFRDPRVMPTGARGDHDRALAAGLLPPRGTFRDVVSVGDLDLLVGRALAPDSIGEAPPIRSRRRTGPEPKAQAE